MLTTTTALLGDGIQRSAWIEGPDDAYRYSLWRGWAVGPNVLWVLANPSTADASVDDPTVLKGMGFSRRWGFAGMVFVNLCAWRATHPRQLQSARKGGADVVGPKTDEIIKAHAAALGRVVFAWGDCLGALGKERAEQVHQMLISVAPLTCLGRTAKGNPKHPLMLPYTTKLEPY